MPNVQWDYTELAHAYAGRPGYAPAAISEILARAGLRQGDRVCDVGAGTGHLTVELLARGMRVDAVEPNDAMREIGEERTRDVGATWFAATGEATGRPAGTYALVTFGSSFNVVERHAALSEAARILERPGWLACLWNHRDLDDPLQAEIEALIRSRVPDYRLGYRRDVEAPPELIETPLFAEPHRIEARVLHEVDPDTWVDAWRSHATLARQAGDETERIVREIGRLVDQAREGDALGVPYTTRGWVVRTTDV